MTVQLRPSSSAETEPLEALYRECRGTVVRVVRSAGVAASDVDDVVHDTFVSLHRKRASQPPDVSVRQWAAAEARRVAFSHRRSNARRARRYAELMRLRATEVDLDASIATRRRWRALQSELEQLPAEQREVFLALEVEQRSAPEVARALGVPVDTVYSRLRLARRKVGTRRPDRTSNLGFVWGAVGWGKVHAVPITAFASALALVLWIGNAGTDRPEPLAEPPAPAAIADAPVDGTRMRVGAGTRVESIEPQRKHELVTTSPEQAGLLDLRPPEPPAARVRRPRRTTSPKPSGSVAASPPDPLALEVAALESLRHASAAGKHRDVLHGVEQYRRQHPRGTLRAEALALGLEVACRLDDPSARAYAAELREHHGARGLSLVETNGCDGTSPPRWNDEQ